jgi:hypothetical protein
MACWRIDNLSRLFAVACLTLSSLSGSEHYGQVTFNGLPVPGATVTASQSEKRFTTVTDIQGLYLFPDLTDGTWTMQVGMLGFAVVQQGVVVGQNALLAKWELKLLPLDQIKAEVKAAAASAVPAPQAASEQPKPQNTAAAPSEPSDEDLNQRAADGFLINGSTNNGASSPFSLAPAFGNRRHGGRQLYNGSIGLITDNSALDAQQFSLTGQNSPKPSYSRFTGVATFGGPLQIPHLFKNGPNIFVAYQWTRNNTATNEPALMPDSAERSGVFSSSVLDPLTGRPFPGNAIPQNRISPQARALLSFYPLPNFKGNTGYNYQIPILDPTHQDALQSRFDKTLGSRDQIYGRFAFQSTRSDNSNLFDFLDASDRLGVNTDVNWSHRLNHTSFLNLGYQFSRLSARVTPFFENRANVSGDAGISGNDQTPMNWGPPSLTFASGIAGLSDAQPSFDRNQTSGASLSLLWTHRAHNIRFGTDCRRQEFNYLSQQNPRGAFTFTGEATGSDFADFLVGIPDTSSIAFGNADKYFRESVYDAFVNDDWRVGPGLTLNAGLRWEYGAPITELYGRLVNLDIAPGFAAVAPLVASRPAGMLTGQRYPNSLVRPDKSGIEPRVGIAWRPISGSSMVIRSGYGVYYDTSVYQTIALQMAQQPPLSKSFSVQNSSADPLTLANGFNASPTITGNTFAIDPNFRVGYAQNWQLSVQRDLPGSLQMTATYLGIKEPAGRRNFCQTPFPVVR